MSLGSRLRVLLFVTKVLGTCTCSWLKKYLMPSKYFEYLYLFLQIWKSTCTWLKYFWKYLTPTLLSTQLRYHVEGMCSWSVKGKTCYKHWCVAFYASAFRRRRHYVFGLSVRPSVHPSVRLKPEIPSIHLYMSRLVHPTNRDRFAACPSVCPERFLGIWWRTHGGNGPIFCMLMYLGHL